MAAGVLMAARRTPTRRDRVVLACCLAWAVPVAVAVVRAVTSGWYPISDEALIAIRARDVLTEHHPLLGTAASAALGDGVLTNHPGPLLFDVAALPVRLFGSGTGLIVAIAAINLGAGLVAIVAAARQGGRAAAITVTVGLCALVWSAGNAVLIDPYNPTACMVPFFAVLLLAWATLNGDRWALPWLVGLGSFCVQTNLAYLVTTVPIVAGALGIYVWRARGRRPGRDVLRRCAPVLLIVWAQPIIEQVLHVTDGNVARLARASRSLQEPLGAGDGTRQAASVLSRWPGWARGNFDGNYVMSPFVARPSVLPALVSLVALIAVLLALSIVSARWLRDRSMAALLAAGAAFVVIGWVATIRVPLSPFYGFLPHFVRWLWPIGVMVAVAIGLFAIRAAQRWVPPTPVPVVAVVALMGGVALAVPDGPQTIGDRDWNTARPVAVELNRLAVERLPESGVTVDFRPPEYPPFAFSLLAALQEHGTPFAVIDGISLRQFGDDRRPSAEPAQPVVYVAVGLEALDTWDGAVACASALDEAQRDRLAEVRVELTSALSAPGFSLSEVGARFADSAFAAPWMASVPEGLPAADVATIVDSAELAILLGDGLIAPPARLAESIRDFVELREGLEDNTACVIERTA